MQVYHNRYKRIDLSSENCVHIQIVHNLRKDCICSLTNEEVQSVSVCSIDIRFHNSGGPLSTLEFLTNKDCKFLESFFFFYKLSIS